MGDQRNNSDSLRYSWSPLSAKQLPDFESFKGQETAFVLINLFVLTVLLLIHSVFARYWGDPSKSLITILAGAFLVQGAELLWLQLKTKPMRPEVIGRLGWSSICFNTLLAVILSQVTNRPETQYFILLAIPVLVAAFRLALLPLVGVVAVVDAINFAWVWNYGRQQSVAPIPEYFEAMTVSIIYVIVGVLVWLLVNDLRRKEEKLSRSLSALEQARERVLREEKLAAVGRLASAIAHEVRNPVGAIVSALSTAKNSGLKSGEREEMFQIASMEAERLERLTNDFLSYARPRSLQKTDCAIGDLVGYVADVCRPKASAKGLTLQTEGAADFTAPIDVGQMQQALVNLVMNAVEASEVGGRVEILTEDDGGSGIRITVMNGGTAIPTESVAHVFEPFFTTKESGTGLGLAIARGIAVAHGGDLELSSNEPGRICFSMTIPTAARADAGEAPEVKWAEF